MRGRQVQMRTFFDPKALFGSQELELIRALGFRMPSRQQDCLRPHAVVLLPGEGQVVILVLWPGPLWVAPNHVVSPRVLDLPTGRFARIRAQPQESIEVAHPDPLLG